MRAVFKQGAAGGLARIAFPVHRLAAVRVKLRIMLREFDKPDVAEFPSVQIGFHRLNRRIEPERIPHSGGDADGLLERDQFVRRRRVVGEGLFAIDGDAGFEKSLHRDRMHVIRRGHHCDIEFLAREHLLQSGIGLLDRVFVRELLRFFQRAADAGDNVDPGLRPQCRQQGGRRPIPSADNGAAQGHFATQRLAGYSLVIALPPWKVRLRSTFGNTIPNIRASAASLDAWNFMSYLTWTIDRFRPDFRPLAISSPPMELGCRINVLKSRRGFMQSRLPLVCVLLFAIWTVGATQAQITSNPVPTPILKRGLAVEVKDLVRLPDTRRMRPSDQDVTPAGWARVSYVRDLPDGRRFANDSRGFLYWISPNNEPRVYADVAAVFPHTVYNRLESGFIGFVFHPEFARNGLFYTVHAERGPGNPKTPDFIPPGFQLKDVTYHNIITEWHATNPAANVFDGTRRELLRAAHVVANLTHPMGAVEFNPAARPGDADYGLLYTSGSDHGFSNGGGPNSNTASQTQRLDSIMTAILRFDPRSPRVTGGMKGLGDYTLSMANRFAADGDPNTLGEIYAYGFRNAHRLSWDTDGTLFASDIGMNHIEEINIVRNGDNYGWMRREGIWENGRWRGTLLNEMFPLPADVLNGREKDGFAYPVAMYDHDEGRAITDGFAYHGRIEALRGKFIFGDIQNGRLFAADLAELKNADDGIPQTVAPIQEIQLYVRDSSGNRMGVSLRELIDQTMGATISRADLHISRTGDGELLLTSRQDGMIRMLVPDSAPAATPPRR